LATCRVIGKETIMETTRTQKLMAAALVGAITVAITTFYPAPAAAQESSESPLVRQMYNGQWPAKEDYAKFKDQLYFQRAVDAYMLMLPALNAIGMRDGSEGKFGAGYNVLPIWKDRMNAKTWVTTPNCDVIYSMSYLDLKKTGPLVVNAPPRVIGMFTDFFQRTLTDVGAAGPDRGEGGLYLLLPPDYQGTVPNGYYTFRSATYNVFLFFRTVLTEGPDGPSNKEGVALAEMTRVYPWGSLEKDRPAMKFPNASNVPVNMMYPTDFSFWEKLKAFVDYEPVEAIAPEVRGILASIGIIKGVPFNPDAQARQTLTRAVETAPKMIYAAKVAGRADGADRYYTDRQWINVWAGVDALFAKPTYLDIDQRASYFQMAYSSAPAMVNDIINRGSKYPGTYRDGDGDLLEGSNTYKLHLPAGIPAAAFWAVTIYNPADGTMPQTDQRFPGTNGLDKPQYNPDRSVDLYFGPTKPQGVNEKNWIQTLRGKAFMVALRLYGAETAFFDQTWKPDDVVKVK
jgi:hypothetical protein